MTDEELLSRYITTNDNAAITELIARYDWQLRRRIGYAELRGERSTDDVLQQLWATVISKCHTFKPSHLVKPWVWTLANNCTRMSLRRQRRGQDADKLNNKLLTRIPLSEVSTPDPHPGPEELCEQKELLTEALNRLAKLPAQLKEVVVQKYWGGVSNKKGAANLGICELTFQRRLATALNLLRNPDEHHDSARCAA